MKLRNAKPNDAIVIANLMDQLGYGASSSQVERKIAEYSVAPEYAVFVVERDNLVIGVISCHVISLFHQEGSIGRITSLVVDQSHRGLGVGKLLASEADKYFKFAGCVKAEVTSGDHRIDAHAFYESCGYAQNERRFLKLYG